MKRSLIKINPDRCKACGFCVVGCCEGALKLVDNKVVIVDDRYCDGLGACIRYCTEEALSLETRKAKPYSEEAVLQNLIPKGPEALRAHFKQLIDTRDLEHTEEGLAYLKKHNISLETEDDEELPVEELLRVARQPQPAPPPKPAIPAGRLIGVKDGDTVPFQPSELKHFPIKLAFLNPEAGYFRQSHVLLAADCTAFACGGFHGRLLKGKNLAILCPRLETKQETLVRKLVEMFDYAVIESLTTVIMDIPCCEGILKIVEEARGKAKRYIPFKVITLSLNGNTKNERWM